jgi:hypothetical protein
MAFFRSFRKSIESSMKLRLKKWEDIKAIAMAKYEVNKVVAKASIDYDVNKVVAKASIEYYGDKYLDVNKVVAKASIEYYGDKYLKLRPRVVNEREILFLSIYGRFNQTLVVGFHLTVPLLDQVMRTISMEEQNITISDMMARTQDKNETKVTIRFSLKVIKCIKHD